MILSNSLENLSVFHDNVFVDFGLTKISPRITNKFSSKFERNAGSYFEVR